MLTLDNLNTLKECLKYLETRTVSKGYWKKEKEVLDKLHKKQEQRRNLIEPSPESEHKTFTI